jgi:hypothetical protein
MVGNRQIPIVAITSFAIGLTLLSAGIVLQILGVRTAADLAFRWFFANSGTPPSRFGISPVLDFHAVTPSNYQAIKKVSEKW